MVRSSVLRSGLLVLMGWMAVAAPMYGQGTAANPPAFDVVSIKPNKPEGDGNRTLVRMMPDRYLATGVTLKTLIMYAYNLTTPDQVIGVTGAVENPRFDVEAKMDAETVAGLKNLSPEQSAVQRRVMLRAVLADRFKLQVHQETKEMPIYSLVVAKSGFKLKEADPNATYANGIKGPDGPARAGMMMIRNNSLIAQGVPISNLATFLSNQLRRRVLDKTGLTGKYDIDLKWTPEEGRGDDGAAAAETAPSIFTAVQEELGLKLEPARGPVEVVVVDHAELPSEN